MSFRTLDSAEVASKRVLVRVDFNVPMEHGRVVDDARLKAALPTITGLRRSRARVILISHFDRPQGQCVPSMSLRPVAPVLSKLIGAPVAFAEDCIGPLALGAVDKLRDGDVLLLENLRFHPGEETNDPDFCRALAMLGDLYVNDAFSAAHRAHASTEGVAHLLPAYAGRSLQTELEHLARALDSPRRPLIALVGGAKISSKIDLLNNLVDKLDYLVIAGGMANTFLFAQGQDVGASLAEKSLADIALTILGRAEGVGCRVLLPTDVVVAETLQPGAASRVIELNQIRPPERIFDIGPVSLERIMTAISESETLIWNGPLGVVEVSPYDAGTVQVARHVAALARTGKLTAVAGGGDTAAALAAAGLSHDFSFVSTAGGAFLEWMAGKALPGVKALESSPKNG